MNKLLFFILLGLTQSCDADSGKYAVDTYDLSVKNFLQAKKEYELKIDECEKKKEPIKSNELKQINLTKNEFELALVVLSMRADNLCSNSEAGNFAIATSIYRTTAKHYNKKPTIASNYSEELLYGHYWGNLELEVKYLEIKESERHKLEKIEILKTPFSPFKTISQLRLMK